MFSWNRVVKVKLTYFVEVERELARDGTVEPRLEVGGPVLAEDVLATRVTFADSRNPRIHVLATVDVLHCCLSVEEQDVLANVVRAHKLRFWKKFKIRMNWFFGENPGFSWDNSGNRGFKMSKIMRNLFV